MSLIKKTISLFVFILLAFGASAWGGLITGFYRTDNKVVLAKPNESIPNGTRLE